MLQVRPGEAVLRNLAHAAVLGVAAEYAGQHVANLAFSFAAVALDNHHALALVAGNQTIPHVFLEGGDILRVQQILQEAEPGFRLRGVGTIGHGKAAADNLPLFRAECSVQMQRAVLQVDAVILGRQLLHMGHDFEQLQDAGNLPGHAQRRVGLYLLEDRHLQGRFVHHAALGGKERAFGVAQLMR